LKTGENNSYGQDPITKPMSFGDWIKTLLLMIIPIVNIVLLFVWAFGSVTNLNKKNFSRAYLLLMAIVLVLYIIVFGLILSSGAMFTPGMY
jgi:hypothetical protein